MFAGILEVQVPTSRQNRLEQKDNIFTEKRHRPRMPVSMVSAHGY